MGIQASNLSLVLPDTSLQHEASGNRSMKFLIPACILAATAIGIALPFARKCRRMLMLLHIDLAQSEDSHQSTQYHYSRWLRISRSGLAMRLVSLAQFRYTEAIGKHEGRQVQS